MKKYKKTAAERIFRKNISEYIEFFEDGVRLSQDLQRYAISRDLLWHPANELEGLPDVPDPLEDPNLPIPFTAHELAAFMVDGVGAMLPEVFGDWQQQGPDEEILAALGDDAASPREALRESYAAYREANLAVGALDADLQRRAAAVREKCEVENNLANQREGVFDPKLKNNDPEEERKDRRARRARASESIADLMAEARAADRLAKADFSRWRKAIVQYLLAGVRRGPAFDRQGGSHYVETLEEVIETKERRQARRYQMCVQAGLVMPSNDYAALPRGVGKIAEKEGVSRQAFSEDVKAHINRLGAPTSTA